VFRRAPSIRSADALGWALTRAGQPRAGLAWGRRSLRTRSRDPMFRLHAAIAARRSDRLHESRRHMAIARSGVAALSPPMRDLLR
jgi:hypothetical protein